MGIIVLGSLFLALASLLFTKGLYVEWGEMILVAAASCALSLLIGQRFGRRAGNGVYFVATLTAFVCFWAFSLFDLAGDHLMYYLPKEGVFYDGRPLTFGEKINEFSDDLFAVCWVPPLLALTLSFALSNRYRTTKN